MSCHLAVARHGANPDSAGFFLDAGERQTADVDQMLGVFHAHFHQIDEIGSTAQKFRAGLAASQRNGARDIIGP